MELTAGAPTRKGHRNPNPTGLGLAERREGERAISEHASSPTATWSPTGNEPAPGRRQRLDFHPSPGADNRGLFRSEVFAR
jgi:hypothetical protein